MRYALSLIIALTIVAPVAAQPTTFNLVFTGDQEVPGPGDPDGFAFGTVTIDPTAGCCAYGSVEWNFTYGNLGDITGMHFHNAPVGESAGIFLGLPTTTTGGPNTLIGKFDDDEWMIDFTTEQLTTILASPKDFYVNIHTNEFPPGAVRAQLPEPATLILLAGGSAALFVRRRRR